jgi:hypothetical protein
LARTFETKEWVEITSDDKLDAIQRSTLAHGYVKRALNPPNLGMGENGETIDPDCLKQRVVQFFRSRHIRELSKVHTNYGKQAGLVSSRGTNRLRYAPTDLLLQSLVLANVQEELPLETFLDNLFESYGMIVGPRQQIALEKAGHLDLAKSISSQAYRHNQLRLEARLKSMGMLRRLSDSQAYILNPLR